MLIPFFSVVTIANCYIIYVIQTILNKLNTDKLKLTSS